MMLKKILKDIFSQKGIFLMLFLGIIEEIGYAILPYFSKYFIDFINEGNLNKEFYFVIGVSLIVLFIAVLINICREILHIGFKARYQKTKNIYYFQKFLNLDYDVRQNAGTGKTITKITRGVDAFVSLYDRGVRYFCVFVVRFVFIGGLILYYFPPLLGIMIIFCIFMTFINSLLSKKIKKLTDEEQKEMENIGRQTSKIIMESNLIKTLNKEKDELNLLEKLFSRLPKLRQRIYFLNDFWYNIMGIFFRGAEIISYAILGVYVVNSSMTIGEMTMIIMYIGWLWWPISIIAESMSEIRNQVSKIEALENLINKPIKVKDGRKKFELKKGEIVFDNITFAYDERRKIFENFDLKINGGKTFALVGHSGSGKSSLIKLLMRNYLVQNGKILVDGQDLKTLKISTFYENIGYLTQEPAVFDGTIRENLSYASDKKIADEELYKILKKVDLYDLVINSSEKLDTEIGERGLKLSGGEKQRLAIARVFLKNPKILILDEPTSSLDSISENKITQILNNIMKGRTVIVIAHRLQTVMEADKIVVLQEGKIIETGTHEELIQKHGVYSKLVDLQRGIVLEEV